MYLVERDVFALAEQLGYTPDVLLNHRVYDRDFNMFFPWDEYCEVRLYYTTPLDATAFAQELKLVRPRVSDTGWKNWDNALFFEIDIAIGGADGKKVRHGLEPFIARNYWPAGEYEDSSISLLETANMDAKLEYKGHRIQDNIVEIYKSGGRFPIWMACPNTTSELMPPALK
jgi:hypothetical protein